MVSRTATSRYVHFYKDLFSILRTVLKLQILQTWSKNSDLLFQNWFLDLDEYYARTAVIHWFHEQRLLGMYNFIKTCLLYCSPDHTTNSETTNSENLIKKFWFVVLKLVFGFGWRLCPHGRNSLVSRTATSRYIFIKTCLLYTDKRTDIWFRDFMMWKINSGLWNERIWADYEQLLRHGFSLFL